MRKFKLIKQRIPTDFDIGTTAEIIDGTVTIKNCDGKIIRQHYGHHWILKFPDFWEEFIDVLKEYEILSFRRNGSTAYGGIKIKGKDGAFYWDYTDAISSEEELLKSDGFDIYSIKRLKDGKIFTLNQSIKVGVIKCKITEFHIFRDGQLMWISTDMGNLGFHKGPNISELRDYIEPLFTTADCVDIHIGDDYWVYDKYMIMNRVHKVCNASCTHGGDGAGRKYFASKAAAELYAREVEPIYVTNDGVEIFYGDKFCAVQKNTFDLLRGVCALSEPDKWLMFSTEDKAEYYILMNKPCLSILDVISTYKPGTSYQYHKTTLSKLVHLINDRNNGK